MPFDLDRRTLISTGVATGLAAAGATAAAAGPRARASAAAATSFALAPRDGVDQTAELQASIDDAARSGVPLLLAPGRFRCGPLVLRPHSYLVGAAGRTVLEFGGGEAFITASGAPGLRLSDMIVDGNLLGMDAGQATALVALEDCEGLSLTRLDVRRGLLNGITLARSSGAITDCTLSAMSQAGILSLDAGGLEIAHNAISDCAGVVRPLTPSRRC